MAVSAIRPPARTHSRHRAELRRRRLAAIVVYLFHSIMAGGVLALLAATAALGGMVATMGATETAQDLHLALASALWVGVVALAALTITTGGERTHLMNAPRRSARLTNATISVR